MKNNHVAAYVVIVIVISIGLFLNGNLNEENWHKYVFILIINIVFFVCVGLYFQKKH